jgi:hypothetical protein
MLVVCSSWRLPFSFLAFSNSTPQAHSTHHRKLTICRIICRTPWCVPSPRGYVCLQRVAIMLLFRSGLLCDDEVRLQTIVPYLLTQLSDSNAGVRCVQSDGNRKLFLQPHLLLPSVKAAAALAFQLFSISALRFHRRRQVRTV